jgi:hypothetical protein
MSAAGADAVAKATQVRRRRTIDFMGDARGEDAGCEGQGWRLHGVES